MNRQLHLVFLYIAMAILEKHGKLFKFQPMNKFNTIINDNVSIQAELQNGKVLTFVFYKQKTGVFAFHSDHQFTSWPDMFNWLVSFFKLDSIQKT